jgi:transcriptional regulator with XRE-family HTH domain
MELSERLKKIRLAAGYTQKETARKLKILPQSYRDWENGRRNPKKSTLEKLAAIFGVSVSYLLGETDVKILNVNEKSSPQTLISLSERLKTLRLEAGYTQKEIAEKLDKPYQTYQRWEKGKSNPNKGSLQKLAKVFNVPVSYLLGETDVRNLATLNEAVSQLDGNNNNLIDFTQRLLKEQAQPLIPSKSQLFAFEVDNENELSAGLGEGYTNFHSTKTVYWDRDIDYDRAIPIKGDSMEPDYHHGEIALIKSQETINYNGQVCAVDDIETGKIYIKCVSIENGFLLLQSLNDSTDEFGNLLFPDIRIPLEDNPRIIGKVIDHFTPLK